MKTVDLAPLKEIDIQYEHVVTMLEERFKCEWDDAIHESYGKYVNQLRESSKEIKTIRCKAETLEKEVIELKIEELSGKAERLCREADAV